MISTKFIKSSLIYSIIGALPLASSFILLPFYTNLLSTDDFGVLMIYIVFTALIQIIVNFGFDNFVPINFINTSDNPLNQKNYISTAINSLLIIGLFVIVLAFFAGEPFFNVLNNILYKGKSIDFFPWGFMAVITAFFNSMYKTYTNLLVYQQRPVRFFWINIINFSLTIGISVAGLYITPFSLAGPMWGRLLSGFVIFLLSYLFFLNEFGIIFHKKYLKPIFQFCYPLFLYLVILWVLGNIDRYIILFFMNKTEVGIYDFAIKCTLLLDFILNGLGAAFLPKVYDLWKKNNLTESTPEVNRYYNGYTAVILLIMPLFTLVIPLIIPFFVKNNAYYQSFDFLALLTVGFATRGIYTMFIAPVLYFKKTKVLPLIYFITAIIQVILSIILIKHYGLIGAVWAAVITKPIQVLFLFYESKKFFTFKFNKFKIIYLPSFYILLVIIMEIFIDPKFRNWSALIQLVVISLSVLYIYRNEFSLLLDSIKQFTRKK
ncbi:MAG: hypothetical protein A2275_13560 [Bacteroidetes bacterium RIFOXYA12_FULL_35_11]|nr:MAG: hypothetical protein A2X01_20295 [Bacteroidetes bacterium GWF2_35_48]OFY82544.1 MAG: hypothetical protein A2275_13560 [Bacteroidetes bacterium RIFOXYA12_FULL_35_11]OFY93555.1 MAG: hypothetical protein A2491_09320 [Bacteroidetes bacterium RIFOXYC12_FULL_35_7]OFY94490.1 MAG: hypothetical protein A2309_08800 [Bacteroidetes bacterium RIFOXYB2_FULL_35_7]HBX51156.1 hypothetical protein [Bacteroidales bacterium]